MKSCLLLLVSLILFCPLAFALETPQAENLSAMIDTALNNNPELRSSSTRWELFASKVRQASSLDDPMLMLKIQNALISNPLSFSKESMTSKVIGISQQLPFPGKRGLKGEIAAKDAESYRWQMEERKLELTRMVKETWYRIYFTDKALELIDRNILILDDFIALSETKYAVGQGTQQDLFKSRLERSKMLDMRISLQQQRRSLSATLNSLLFRSQETEVGRIADFSIAPVSLSAEELRRAARENRPLIRSLRAQIGKGEAGLSLAEKEFYPDFNVSLEYMQREPAMGNDGDDMYSLGVTFNLPLQKERRHAMVAEANAEIGMATAELVSLENSIDSSIADLLARLEQRRSLVELYRSGIIPQAEQSLESATIGYRVSKVDLLDLLDSRVTLFNYNRDYFESLAEHQMLLAQLEAVVGKDPLLPASPPPAGAAPPVALPAEKQPQPSAAHGTHH